MSSKSMHIAVVIVTYKTKKQDLTNLKNRLIKILGENVDFFVTDTTSHNKGYAWGVNQGIRKASEKMRYDSFIISNPDIMLPEVTRKKFLEAESKFDLWGYAFRQRNTVYFGGKIDTWRLSGGLITKKPADRFFKCDFVSGSLMIIKREVLDRIGLFDENYFLYYEDVDYSLRAEQAGFRIGIDSSYIYTHYEISGTNPMKAFYLARSHKRFFFKYSSFLQKIRECIRYLLDKLHANIT